MYNDFKYAVHGSTHVHSIINRIMPQFNLIDVLVPPACTSVGCSNSPVVTIVTAQIPPASQAPPTLLVRGPTSMEAQWAEPSEPNGVLERYVLYVSDLSGDVGQEVYNTSDLFRDYIITELTAGTLYHVSVAVSTFAFLIKSKLKTVF